MERNAPLTGGSPVLLTTTLAGNPMLVALIVTLLVLTLDALAGMGVAARTGTFKWGTAPQYLATHILPQAGGLGLAFLIQVGANASNIVGMPQGAATAFWVAVAALLGPTVTDLLAKIEALLAGTPPAAA